MLRIGQQWTVPLCVFASVVAAEHPLSQFCQYGAGYYSDDCGTTDPHCWRLTTGDGVRTAEECQRRCAQNPVCAYFSFHIHFGPMCDLLGQDAKHAPKLLGVISGTTTCSIPDVPTECHANAGYASSEPPLPGITDLESCKSSCESSPSCSHFSFNIYLRACAFSNGTTFYPWLIGVVSGRRHCDLPASLLKCMTDHAYWERGAEVLTGFRHADECQQACQDDPACQYFTYNSIVSLCWRMNSTNVSLAPFVDGAVSGRRDCNMSDLCTYRHGSYICGERLPLKAEWTERATLVRGCRQACRETPGCAYFNYQLDVAGCELQDEQSYYDSSATSYISGPKECKLPTAQSNFCFEDAGAYVSSTSAAPPLNLSLPWECQEACNTSSACRYFTYRHSSQECWLMEHAYRSPGLLGYWSGPGDCEMPSQGSCFVDKGYVVDGVSDNFGSASPMGCLHACQREPDCHYFSFHVIFRTCSLLGPNARFVEYLPGVISGPRNCSENKRPSKSVLQLKDFSLIFFPRLTRALEKYVDEATSRDCPVGFANFWGTNRCYKCIDSSARRRGGVTRCVPCKSGTYNIGNQDNCEDSNLVMLREAGKGDRSLVLKLRSLGTDVDLALRNAGKQNDLKAAKTLVKAGADGCAAFRGAVENATDCAAGQGRHGCKQELVAVDCLWRAMGSNTGSAAQYFGLFEAAVDRGAGSVVESLVEKGLFPKRPHPKSLRTPLHNAAARGNENLSVVLIEGAGMRVEQRDNRGLSPIDVALMKGHKREARLLEGYARNWRDAFKDVNTWRCVVIAFLSAAGFWLALSCLGRSCSLRGWGSQGAEAESDGSSDSDGEDTSTKTSDKVEVGQATLGARLLAVRACIPATTGALVRLQRFLGVLANVVFPGTFCARYVFPGVWFPLLSLIYVAPAMKLMGWRTICQKPALVFCFPDSNLLGLHRDRPRRLSHLLFSVMRAGSLLPLAILIGGPQFHESYMQAADRAPGILGAWYVFSDFLELNIPSLARSQPWVLANREVTAHTDLVSLQHWNPAGANVTLAFPMKLCPLTDVFLKNCIIDTTFDMYTALICWYAFLGLATYFWCGYSLALYLGCRESGIFDGSTSETVGLLAVDVEGAVDAEGIANLGPESQELPLAVRKVMRSTVQPVTAFAVRLTAVLIALDLALDLNTQLTMFVEQKYISATLLTWFFFVTLLFELWEGSLFHLHSDAAEAIRRGFPPERTLKMQSRENGFEALGSLLVTTAALLFALKTPFQFITGILSLLSSVNGIASYIFQEVDLLGTRQTLKDAEEEEEEEEDRLN